MLHMRSASGAYRIAAALLLAALLALRSLAPAGFMPSFDGGALTIVACPDFAPPASAHHSSEHKPAEPPCPYAAFAAMAGIDPASALLIALLLFSVALLLGRCFDFAERHHRRRLPPSRAPPLPA